MLNSKLGVNLKLILPPLMKGCGFKFRPYCPWSPVMKTPELLMNCWPESWPRKKSRRISPRYWRMPGNRNGLTRSIRNIRLIGSALLVSNIVPPSLGPHQRLCLPKENCQLARFMPTYASSRRKRLVAAIDVGVRFGGTPSAPLMKFSTAGDGAGPDGADWYSPRA